MMKYKPTVRVKNKKWKKKDLFIYDQIVFDQYNIVLIKYNLSIVILQ